MSFYHWEGEDLILSVYVQTRASQTAIVGIYGDRLKVKTTAAPVEGQANIEICQLLAKVFKVAKSQVLLLRGHAHKNKLYRIQSPKKLPEFILSP